MTTLRKPTHLSSGDTIGIVAPASWPDVEKAEKAVAYLQGLGFRVKLGNAFSRVHGYLAGTDEERVEELHQMFLDDEVKGIFCVCGGYGTPRIAPKLDYDLIRANPKVFWGYSDITFLHIALMQKAHIVTFHGPMLSADLGREEIDPFTQQTFEQLLVPTAFRYTEKISPLRSLVEGKAAGALVGGNLSLLVSTLGTPFEVDTKGKLFFIEEVDEEPYQIDRMLNQLKLAGKFDDAAAMLLCDFRNCEPKKRKQSLTLEEVFYDHVVPAGKPTLSGFKVGHCRPNIAFPIGAEATVDTMKKVVAIENPFSKRERC